MYLLFTTLEMVEMSKPVTFAISSRIIGLSLVSSPVSKNTLWKSIIACIVLLSVFCLCVRASTNHLALSIFSFTKLAASFFSLSLPPRAFSSIAAYFLLMRISGILNRGIMKDTSPSSSLSTKSGTICSVTSA